jgi:transposase
MKRLTHRISDTPLGHGAFDEAVRDIIEADDTLSHVLLPMLDARWVLYQTFHEVDNRTRNMTNNDPVYQRLMGAPGVGFVARLEKQTLRKTPPRWAGSFGHVLVVRTAAQPPQC